MKQTNNTPHKGKGQLDSESKLESTRVFSVKTQLLWDTVATRQRDTKRNGFPNMLLAVF